MKKMFLAGEWRTGNREIPVKNPYDDTVLDTVPAAAPGDVERALEFAARGAATVWKIPGYERYLRLRRAADLLQSRAEEFSRTITLEEGKVLAESRVEVSRAVATLTDSAEEAKRIAGEVVPLDGAPGTGNRFGFTLRVPCGVVVAISPFNFPLNLVAHKVGPALAAGNTLILKPATDTPLTALKLTEILLEAGFPPEAIQCLTGPGAQLGEHLCADPRVRKITFTGSRDVGERICRMAGIKKVTMELGGNCPVIVLPDADLEAAARAIVSTGYSNAGQVCISAQRILAHRTVYGDLLDAVNPQVEAIRAGDPLDPGTGMGPMIRAQDARRVHDWIAEAVASGARVTSGGGLEGAIHAATVVADVKPELRISCDELFGPAVAFTPVATIEEAIDVANSGRYGLSAGVFTRDLNSALRFAREVESGNLHINWGPQWRADLMPYGGLKESGFGKEGPRYAVQEMTEAKMVVVHL